MEYEEGGEQSRLTGNEQVHSDPKTQDEDSEDDDGGWCFSKNKNEDDHPVGDVDHHCTDLICLAAFIAAMFGFGIILQHAWNDGDMRRLYHGYDFLGNLCGLDNQTDKPFLYYCKSDTGLLDLQHPICRETCPTIDEGQYSCYWQTETGPRNPHIPEPNLTNPDLHLNIQYSPQSFSLETTYLYRLRDDYVSFPLGGAYCMPSNRSSPVFTYLQDYLQEQPLYKILSEMRSVENAWSVLLGVAGIAFVLAFLYLFLLEHFACCLVYTALTVLIGSLMSFGGYAIYVWSSDGDGIDNMPGTGDRNADLAIGILSLIVGTAFLVVTICCNEAIQIAIAVIKATAECMMCMRSLLIEPVITVLYKTAVFSALLSGFFLLLSCGTMTTSSIEQYAAMTMEGAPSGILRSFTYTDDEYKFIWIYAFVIVWLMQLASATSQFVLAYIVKSWYFTPYEGGEKHDIPSCPLIRGYICAWMYHLGSLAYGSFIITVLFFIRVILNQIAKQAKSDGNAVLSCVASALSCCVYCFKKCMEFINKNAYMDIACNSNNFCTAAYNAFWFIVKSMPEIAVLNGACCIFVVAGTLGISSGSAYLCFISLGYFDVYTNPTSEWYVSDKVMVTCFAFGVALIVSYSFMTVFDMVADTILFCFAVEKKRRKTGGAHPLDPSVQYSPEKLDRLVSGKRDAGTESDGE